MWTSVTQEPGGRQRCWLQLWKRSGHIVPDMLPSMMSVWLLHRRKWMLCWKALVEMSGSGLQLFST
ncbi:hypothetical protein BC830DRAFT_1105748 [Chytriomyces sp. MP71]|nr:hypothetical protein BC830DRAFT_1105748 [Chytriomyces sp. MP71]